MKITMQINYEKTRKKKIRGGCCVRWGSIGRRRDEMCVEVKNCSALGEWDIVSTSINFSSCQMINRKVFHSRQMSLAKRGRW